MSGKTKFIKAIEEIATLTNELFDEIDVLRARVTKLERRVQRKERRVQRRDTTIGKLTAGSTQQDNEIAELFMQLGAPPPTNMVASQQSSSRMPSPPVTKRSRKVIRAPASGVSPTDASKATTASSGKRAKSDRPKATPQPSPPENKD